MLSNLATCPLGLPDEENKQVDCSLEAPIPRYLTEDQALAWMYWRGEESVARVGPQGDTTFRSLRQRREWRCSIDSSARMEWRNMGGPVGETADGRLIYASPPSENAYRLLCSPPPPRPGKVGEFAALQALLYSACERGEIDAWGRFNNGELKRILAVEFAEPRRPAGWTDLRFEWTALRRLFPPLLQDCFLSHAESAQPPPTSPAVNPASANRGAHPKPAAESAPRPGAPDSKVRDWYKGYVTGHAEKGTTTSENDDWIAAREKFGDKVRQLQIREIRRELAPPVWRKQGRRPRRTTDTE
jgi:hypothetical protein